MGYTPRSGSARPSTSIFSVLLIKSNCFSKYLYHLALFLAASGESENSGGSMVLADVLSIWWAYRVFYYAFNLYFPVLFVKYVLLLQYKSLEDFSNNKNKEKLTLKFQKPWEFPGCLRVRLSLPRPRFNSWSGSWDHTSHVVWPKSQINKQKTQTAITKIPKHKKNWKKEGEKCGTGSKNMPLVHLTLS